MSLHQEEALAVKAKSHIAEAAARMTTTLGGQRCPMPPPALRIDIPSSTSSVTWANLETFIGEQVQTCLRRVLEDEANERIESRILPLFERRTAEVAKLLPALYLHGLSSGDFTLALRGPPGRQHAAEGDQCATPDRGLAVRRRAVTHAGPVRARGRQHRGARRRKRPPPVTRELGGDPARPHTQRTAVGVDRALEAVHAGCVAGSAPRRCALSARPRDLS